jgi:hypothetical protein
MITRSGVVCTDAERPVVVCGWPPAPLTSVQVVAGRTAGGSTWARMRGVRSAWGLRPAASCTGPPPVGTRRRVRRTLAPRAGTYIVRLRMLVLSSSIWRTLGLAGRCRWSPGCRCSRREDCFACREGLCATPPGAVPLRGAAPRVFCGLDYDGSGLVAPPPPSSRRWTPAGAIEPSDR